VKLRALAPTNSKLFGTPVDNWCAATRPAGNWWQTAAQLWHLMMPSHLSANAFSSSVQFAAKRARMT